MAARAPFFADVSELLADNEPMLAYGVCGFDADGDGRDELFVCGFGDANRLLKWDGEQVIDLCRADAAFVPLADEGRMSIGCCAADIDGDGREELYVLTSDVFGGAKRFTDRLFSFENGQWRDLFTGFEHAAVMNLVAGRSVAAIDRHGQGRYGFLLAAYGGPSVLYEMDSRGRLFDMSEAAGLRFTTGGRSLLVGPLFGSGRAEHKPDVFCGNEGGSNFAFINAGDGTFTNMAEEMGLADAQQHARGVVALDAGGLSAEASGRFAIACANWEGPSRLFVPRGSTREGFPIFTNLAPANFARPAWVRSILCCDFDHDGHDELFLHHMGQPNSAFRSRKEGLGPIDPGPAAEATGLGTGCAWCDIDGDGICELLLCHGEVGRQPLTLFKPRHVSEQATVIRPRVRSGAPARHALVTSKAGGRERSALIDAASGYLCQMPPVARFAGKLERVRVVFPNGRERVTDAGGLGLGSELVLEEPGKAPGAV